MTWRFPIWYFLCVLLCGSRWLFVFVPSSSPNSFPILLIQSALMLCSLRFHIFSKMVLFICHHVVGMSLCYHLLFTSRYFSLFWNVIFCLYSFILSQYLFSLPYFVSIFWFISSSCISCFSSWVTFFSLSLCYRYYHLTSKQVIFPWRLSESKSFRS